MSRAVVLVDAPSSAGAYAPGQEKAPAALREAGLVRGLTAAGITVREGGSTPRWRWRPDPTDRLAQNHGAVVATAAAVAERVRAVVDSGDVAVVLGGDCTVGVGTVAGHLPAAPTCGLLYFDLHADLNTPHAVADGALDWMGLAHLLAEEGTVPELREVGSRVPLLAAAQVLLFGYDAAHSTPWEQAVIRRRSLTTVPVAAVRADPEDAARQALAHLHARCDRLLIHFDVDVIDFTDAPLSENTGRNYGLSLDTALRALTVLLGSARLSALTLTELNPDHGAEDGSTLRTFVAGLTVALARAPVLR